MRRPVPRVDGAADVRLLAALLLGRDRFGVAAGRAGLVVGLAGVNVVLGYLDAETVVVVVVAELALLFGYRRYRSRFLGAHEG